MDSELECGQSLLKMALALEVFIEWQNIEEIHDLNDNWEIYQMQSGELSWLLGREAAEPEHWVYFWSYIWSCKEVNLEVVQKREDNRTDLKTNLAAEQRPDL